MRKFKNKTTGIILVPNNKMVIEQLEKSEMYEEVGAKNTSTTEKAIKDYTKKELVAYLTELGIECNEDMKKDELLSLIPDEDKE